MPDRPQRAQKIAALGLFLFASALYIWGVSPTIAWRDSPEFVTTAHTLDISHPAGSPTYSLIAKSTTFIPIGSVALRVNLFSACMGGITVSLLFSLLYNLLTDSPQWVRWCAALSGGLSLLVSESFWCFAEVAEVYSLQNAVLVVLLTILLKAYTCPWPARMRYDYLFAFLYGMSAGVHATMALFAPAFLVFIALREPRSIRSKGLAFLAFLFLLGFAVYLYLPLRSLTDPAFDWGDPETFQQFLLHIFDRKDTAQHTIFGWQRLPSLWHRYMTHLVSEFSTLGFFLGMCGCIYLLLRRRYIWILFALTFLGHVLFFVSVGWSVAWGFIPSYVIFSCWIASGVHACLVILADIYQRHTIRFPRIAIYVCLLGGILLNLSTMFVRHLPTAFQTGNYSAVRYGKQLLVQLPSDALLFCDYAWFPLLYLQQVEQRRPDLIFMLQGEVFFPQYFALPSTKRFPNIDHVTSSQPIHMSPSTYFWNLSRLNSKEHPLFWEPDGHYQFTIADYLLPHGMIFSFNPHEKTQFSPEKLILHNKLLLYSIKNILRDDMADEATLFLTRNLGFLAEHWRKVGYESEASKTYHTALGIRPYGKNIRNNYGAFLMSIGELEDALEQLRYAYSQAPFDPVVNKNMGNLLIRIGQNALAAHYLKQAIAFGGMDGDTYALLGAAYTKLELFPEALQALQAAESRLASQHAQYIVGAELQKKIAWIARYKRRVEAALHADSH